MNWIYIAISIYYLHSKLATHYNYILTWPLLLCNLCFHAVVYAWPSAWLIAIFSLFKVDYHWEKIKSTMYIAISGHLHPTISHNHLVLSFILSSHMMHQLSLCRIFEVCSSYHLVTYIPHIPCFTPMQCGILISYSQILDIYSICQMMNCITLHSFQAPNRPVGV